MKRNRRNLKHRGMLLLLALFMTALLIAAAASEAEVPVETDLVVPVANDSGNMTEVGGGDVRINAYSTKLYARGDRLYLDLVFEAESFEGDISLTAYAMELNKEDGPYFASDPVTVEDGAYSPGELTLEMKPKEGIQLADYPEYTVFTVSVSVQGTSSVTGLSIWASNYAQCVLTFASYLDIGSVSFFTADNQYLGMDITWSGKWDAEEGTEVHFGLSSNDANMSLDLGTKIGSAQEGSFSGMAFFPSLGMLKDRLGVWMWFKEKDGSWLRGYGETSVSSIHPLETARLPLGMAILGEESLSGIAAECVMIPAETRTVARDALRGCEKMKVLIVKGAATEIPAEALADCPQLRTIIVNDSNQAVRELGESMGLTVSSLGWW